MFADTSIFSTVRDLTKSGMDFNQDLNTIKNWAFKWKMTFNPDPKKQATEVIFSHKTKPVNHPPLCFNDYTVVTSPIQKHLGLILDKKFTFDHHLNEKISKANKGISLKNDCIGIFRLSHYCVFTSRLLGLILITLMLYMISPTITAFATR